MKDELIKFETAKLATSKGIYEIVVIDYNMKTGTPIVLAPTQSLLQRWLREKHNIVVLAQEHKDHAADVNDPYEWYPYIRTSKVIINYNNFDHGSYELALEAGLQKALELL